MSLEAWKSRYTVRRFDTEYIPNREKIDYLKNCIEFIPSQLGVIDHIWCVLGPDHREQKKWLVDNIYFCDDKDMGHYEYFTALMEAPYVFHSFRVIHPRNTRFGNQSMNQVTRNNAFHAGAIVTEALKQDLDVCQICCTDGTVVNPDIMWEYREKIWNAYGKLLKAARPEASAAYIGEPMISIGLGKGLPNTEQDYTPYKDGVSFTGQKFSKPMNNCVEI